MKKFFMSPLSCLAFLLVLPLSVIADKRSPIADEESAKCGCNANKPPRVENSDDQIPLDENSEELVEFIARLSAFDEDAASPLHKLNMHIAKGNSVILKDDLVKALAHAESVIAEYNDQMSDDQVEKISDTFNALIDVVAQDDLSVKAMEDTRDCGSSCDDPCDDDSALKIKKILCVLNKAIFCDIAIFRNGAIFCQNVEMNRGLDVRHRLFARKAKMERLKAHRANIKRLDVDRLDADNATIDTLEADNATIDTLEVCTLNVTCTANMPDIVVCDLDVTCTATIEFLEVLTTALVDCDLYVGCNINMSHTTGAAVGNIYKSGAPFIHDFGTQNTFVGVGAGNFTMSGVQNSGFGTGALFSNTSGILNTAVGAQALINNTTGSNNMASGFQALFTNTTGSFNAAAGLGALFGNTTGSFNAALGQAAMQSNTTGNNNTASGFQALRSNITGADNVAIGANALFAATAAFQLTAVGSGALQNNVAGNQNVAVGYQSLNANTAGGSNTAVGYQSLTSNTTGNFNTASGAGALFSNLTGSDNIAVGASALSFNTSGSDNVAIGLNALSANTTGIQNIAIGTGALATNITSGFNTAVGYQALQSSTTGLNAALGWQAMLGNTTGINNTASGAQALFDNTTGNFNTALGAQALSSNTTGSNNIAVGVGAGFNVAAGSNNIHIGAFPAADESNAIRIGVIGTQATNFQAGIFGAGPIVGAAVLVDATTGQLGTVSSSIRYKENVADMKEESAAILELRPVSFTYKADAKHAKQFGLIAEEVNKVMPALVVKGADGQIETVKYHELATLLLNELIKQHGIIDELKKDQAMMSMRLAELEAAIN